MHLHLTPSMVWPVEHKPALCPTSRCPSFGELKKVKQNRNLDKKIRLKYKEYNKCICFCKLTIPTSSIFCWIFLSCICLRFLSWNKVCFSFRNSSFSWRAFTSNLRSTSFLCFSCLNMYVVYSLGYYTSYSLYSWFVQFISCIKWIFKGNSQTKQFFYKLKNWFFRMAKYPGVDCYSFKTLNNLEMTTSGFI